MSRHTFWTLLAAGLLVACGSSQNPTNPTNTDTVVTQVTVTVSSSTLNAFGDTVSASAVGKNAAGSAVATATFTWTSSDPSVATVNSTGRITAVNNGTVTITATSGGVQGSATVTVDQTVASIAVSPSTVPDFTNIGDTVTLHATPQDSRGNTVDGVTVSWTTSDSTVASVNAGCTTGEANVGCVLSTGDGTATITASASGETTTRGVAVTQHVVWIFITPSGPLSFDAVGATADLAATPTDTNDFPVSGVTVTWASSNTNVATVNQSGHVVSTGNGTARITAGVNGRLDTVNVTVSQVATSVNLTCAGYANLTYVGETVQCSAVPWDRLNHDMPGTITWSVDNSNIATIDQTGLLTAVDNGAVYITAAYGSVFANQEQDVQLQMAYGDVRTGNIKAAGYGQRWRIVSDATTRGLVMWSMRNPASSGTLDPHIYLTNVNLTRQGATTGRLDAGAELLALTPFDNSVTTNVYEQGDNSTYGGYTLALADCARNGLPGPGYYSWGSITNGSCAVLNGSGRSSSPNLTGANVWAMDFTAGNQVTVQIIAGCTTGATNNLACTGTAGTLDPYMYVFAPDGTVMFNDDGAGGVNSSLTFTPPVTGTYTVLATTYTAGETGSYTICSFSNCANSGPPPAGVQYQPTPVTRMPAGWSSGLTVDKAYARLKKLGIVPQDFDPRTARPPKPGR